MQTTNLGVGRSNRSGRASHLNDLVGGGPLAFRRSYRLATTKRATMAEEFDAVLVDIDDSDNIGRLLDDDFDDGLLICRLFLGLSKDQFTASLTEALGSEGAGRTRFKRDRKGFISGLAALGVPDAIIAEIKRESHWSDTLVGSHHA